MKNMLKRYREFFILSARDKQHANTGYPCALINVVTLMKTTTKKQI